MAREIRFEIIDDPDKVEVVIESADGVRALDLALEVIPPIIERFREIEKPKRDIRFTRES